MKQRSRLITALFIILIFLAAHYFFRSSRVQNQANWIDRFVVMGFQPVTKLFNSTLQFFSSTTKKYLLCVKAQEENKILKDTLNLMRLQNRSLRYLLNQKYDEAKAEMFYDYMGHQITPVNILGHDPFLQSKTLWIDAGLDQGIEVNTVVVSGGGLVGRVIQVFDNSSKVLLLIDSYGAVDTYNQRTGMRSLVRGMSQLVLKNNRMPYLSQIEYQELGQEFREGDVLLTSGMGGIYPKGIPVGKIIEVSADIEGFFESSLVLPAVDFTKVQNLYVLVQRTP